MKRFIKTGAACALALALMSTSAFAAVSGGTAKFEDGKLNVTIEGTDESEQVALLVLNGAMETSNLASVKNTDIAYIDQKAGGAGLAFNGINVGNVKTVTVFAGSTNTIKGAFKVGTINSTPPELNANKLSFNVVKDAWTDVDLKLTDEEKNEVFKGVVVTYKTKDTEEAYLNASDKVQYDVDNSTWKINFSKSGTYTVRFTNGTLYKEVTVCVYDKKLPVGGIGEAEKPFVMKQDDGSTKTAAVVKVKLDEATKGAGKLIWSIKTSDGVRHYTNPVAWDISSVSGPVAIGCVFDNDIGATVTAVNVIYKDKDGVVFFTDGDDAANETKRSSAE